MNYEAKQARQLDSKSYKNREEDIGNMAKATEQRHSMRFLSARLLIVILSLHILFVGFLIQSTSQSQNLAKEMMEKCIQEPKKVTGPTEVSSINEKEENQETNGNTEALRSGEDRPTQIEPDSISTPTPTANNADWGIYSNTPSLDVYSDSSCTQPTAPTDLGTISPGGSVTKTFYLKNIGNQNLTLTLHTKNWTPASANGPIILIWDREGTVLVVNQVLAATLTLYVSPDIKGITAFSLNVVISGTI